MKTKNIFFASLALTLGMTLSACNSNAPTVESSTPQAANTIGYCWNEPNSYMPSGYETICGSPTLAPVGSIDFSYDGVEVMEDSPLWQCAYMGNRVCGPTQ